MKNGALKNTVGIAIAVLAAAAVAYWGFLAPRPPEGGTAAPAQGFAVSMRSIDESGPGYAITGSYPELSGAKNAGAFNGYVSAVVREEESVFKQGLGDMASSFSPADLAGMTSTLAIRSSIVATSTNFVGILLSTDDYLVGMAHPAHAMASVNFDLATGRDIALGDLFAPGSDYLAVIASSSAADVARQIREGAYASSQSYIDQSGGLLPDPANFQVFSITPEGLIVYFQEYQVGPYASGRTSTTIPWSALSGILNPVGPLSHLF